VTPSRSASCINLRDTPARLQARRTVLKAALGLGLTLALPEVAAAVSKDPRVARPRKGDRFVVPYGDRAGTLIRAEDLPLGGPQQIAYPMDPVTAVVRDGSLLNQVVLVRLDPARLSAETRVHAAGGVVAYSAVCTHQGCPVSMWHEESKALFCACHATRFDPADRARVLDGPAPRRLPILPLGAQEGVLVAAGEFSGRVGAQTH
jgi:rieske iron-sulfur protein